MMTFGKSRFNRDYEWELVRFCSSRGHTIVGGASKLLAAFRRENSGSIVTYADKRYSEGNLYFQMGFRLDGESDPSFGYYCFKDGNLYSRLKFQKHKLRSSPHYSDDLVEYEIMRLDGYERVWDAGQYRFVMD